MLLAFLLMSLGALLRGASATQGHGAQGQRRQHKFEARSIEASLVTGERIETFFRSIYGEERSSEMLEKVAARSRVTARARGSQPRTESGVVIIDVDAESDAEAQAGKHTYALPRGFWIRFIQEDLGLQPSKRKSKQCQRALELYAVRKCEGASTMTAMRGMRKKGSCRGNGGALNARKAAGLCFMLLQFFVDNVQRLQCRSDSCMLMKQAREFRADLDFSGFENLPKLIGSAGYQWFWRWRQMYGIVKKVCGMKLKVPWTKVKRRVRVLLSNIYRLRAFWELCHPGVPMRFISLDQKPSWFNNAGLTGTFAKKGGSQPSVRENFAKTRERYTILTAVVNSGNTDPDDPPKVAVLFKGMPNGRIIQHLRTLTLKPWMKVQVQEYGSYRSSDMVEALDWMLPQANDSSESMVLLLDWYSGHLTEEVAELVRRKGHVLLFHGGGCTPFTQVNDTHLHASLARLLIQIENEWAQKERERLLGLGQNKTPNPKREDLLSFVEAAWLCIDHANCGEKAYKQTGPTMPLRGPVKPEEVFHDLLTVMEELNPSHSPTEVNMTFRDEAVAFVKEGWDAGKWRQWSDCHKLIEEQDGLDEKVEEGLEAFGEAADKDEDEADVTDEESEDEDEEDDGAGDDSDDEGGGGGSGGLSAKKMHGDGDLGHDGDGDDEASGDAAAPGGAAATPSGGAGDGPSGKTATPGPGSSGAADASGGSAEPSSSAAGSAQSMDLASARKVLYDEAVRTKQDTMIRHLRKQMREETQNEKDVATETGKFLRKRLQEQQDAAAKRQRAARAEERLAAKDIEETKLLRARAEQKTAENRLASLRQTVLNKREAELRKREAEFARAFQRWLQTQYPAILARRCFQHLRALTKEAKASFTKDIEEHLKARTFLRQVIINNLWEPDKTLTQSMATSVNFSGGPRRSVNWGLTFQEVVDDVLPKKFSSSYDPVELLNVMFTRCMPCARQIFTGSYSALRLLHFNDYVLEKAFVYGILALSKWLGQEKIPPGFFGNWPPKAPKDLVPRYSSLPTGVGHPDDPILPPHLRIGQGPSSSGSAAPSKP